MYFDNLLNHGAVPALVATLSYTDARHRMIAENLANVATPGYRARQLDTAAFQQALGEALHRRVRDPRTPFVLDETEFRTDQRGSLQVRPSLRPVDNLLFHDGTNLSIDREMADLAENTMTHKVTSELLRRRFQGLATAIRGNL